MGRSDLNFYYGMFSRWFRIFAVLGGLTSPFFVVARFSTAQEYPPTVRSEVSTKWDVAGTVVTESGIGIPNATAWLFYQHRYQPQVNEPISLGERIECDRGGRFEKMTGAGISFLSFAPGYAPKAIPGPNGSAVEIVLNKGRTIRGRVLLPSGKPAKGVLVSPVIFHTPREITKEQPMASTPFRQPPYVAAAFPERGKDWASETDAEGEFEIDRLPLNSRVGLSIYLSGYLEEVVYVRGDNDDRIANPSEKILTDDDFVHRLTPSSVLKLKGVDAQTGRPAKIRSIGLKMNDRSNQPVIRRPFDSATPSLSLRKYPRGLTVWVEPVDERLLAYRFELPAIGSNDVIDQTVEFRHGRMVNGIVKSADGGAAIQNVELYWRTPTGDQVAEDGDYTRAKIISDEDGRFSVAVPNGEGVLGIVGNVDRFQKGNGYQYAPYWTKPDLFKGLEDVLERHTRLIPAIDAGDLEIAYELLPAWTVEAKTIDADGKPISDVVITTNFATGMFGDPNSYSIGTKTIDSDVNGIARLTNLYNDEYQLRLVQRFVLEANGSGKNKSTSLQKLMYAKHRGFPGVLEAFALDGHLQGKATIPIPKENDELVDRVIRVDLNLAGGASVEGQIVDQNGKGIGGLSFSLASESSVSRSSQSWRTKTREDGRFRVVGIPTGGKLGWSVDSSRVSVFQPGVEIDATELPDGGTLQLGLVRCYDFSMLAEPLPKLDVSGLSDDDALAKISTYVKTEMARIPNVEGLPLMVGGSSAPIPTFQSKLIRAVLPALKQLAGREPGSNFELKALKVIWELAASRAFHMSIEAANSKRFVGHQLLKNQMDNDAAQSLLLVALSDGETTVNMGAVLPQLTKSKFPKTRLRAAAYLAMMQIEATSSQARQSVDPSKFDSEFQKLEKSLEQLKKHSKDFEDPATIERVRKLFYDIAERNRAYLNVNPDAPEYIRKRALDPKRYDKMLDLLQGYLGD